jgi:outer membrane protein TolC
MHRRGAGTKPFDSPAAIGYAHVAMPGSCRRPAVRPAIGSSICIVACLSVLAGGSALSESPRRPLTFSEAIDVALGNGLQVRAAGQGVIASEMRVRGATSQRLPSLKADANLQWWDKPLDIAFGGTPGMPDTFHARDQLTWQATVTLAQPISGLLVLSRLVALEKSGAEAARADQAQARLDTAQRVAEAYLRLLQARALESVAVKSVEQVDAQLARAKILEQGGVFGHVDVLRLTAARETARQGLLRGRTSIAVATAALGVALDYPPGAAIDVVDDLPDPPPPLTWRDADATAEASRARPEIAAARQRGEQAVAGRGIALSRMLPSIVAIGTYQHTEGQSFFQPKDAWFVGGVLSWDLWDWGKNWSGVKEAEAKAGQALIGVEVLERQIMFEAQRTLLEARTAYETIASARAELEAADEAYRIQSVRYSQGAATTTDVLAGEADLSRARGGYAQARTDVYLAQVALARAVGRAPSTQLAAELGGKK